MLVLSRKPGQECTLTLPTDPQELAALAGAVICVSIQSTQGNSRDGYNTWIGFQAPRSIQIVRHDAGIRTPKVS